MPGCVRNLSLPLMRAAACISINFRTYLALSGTFLGSFWQSTYMLNLSRHLRSGLFCREIVLQANTAGESGKGGSI